jgi:hypothetical protein
VSNNSSQGVTLVLVTASKITFKKVLKTDMSTLKEMKRDGAGPHSLTLMAVCISTVVA